MRKIIIILIIFCNNTLLGLAGLENYGNICYMNATLQALFACKPLTGELEKLQAQKQLNAQPLLKEYYTLMKDHQKKNVAINEPVGFLTCVRESNLLLGENPNTQQDASEFLNQFLDRINVPSIKNIFSFSLRTYYECTDAQKTINNKEEIFNKLDLEFTPLRDQKQQVSLDDLFNKFYEQELFKASEQPKCFSDPTKKIASNWRAFVSGPKVLIVVPKRFGVRQEKGTFESFKILNPIVNALQPISLHSENGRLQYNLFACVIHTGSTDSGHYMAVVRYGNQWFFCDDDTVLPVTVQEAQQYTEGRDGRINGQGYIYFFERA